MFKDPGLLNDRAPRLPAVAISSVWASLGFTFIVVTAALQSVPGELYESAYVDGAGGWTRFTNVTLPMISPTLLFVTVVLTTRAFQTYGEVDLLTAGGPEPDSARPRPWPTWSTARPRSSSNDIGLKSASAVLLFVRAAGAGVRAVPRASNGGCTMAS